METISQQAANLRTQWETDHRWATIERTFTAQDVVRLRGSVVEEHTLARRGANRLWELLHSEDAVRALGAITGNQAVQMVKAGLQAIYLSGWQVAADGNLAGQTKSPGRNGPWIPPPPASSGSLRSWRTPRPGSAAR